DRARRAQRQDLPAGGDARRPPLRRPGDDHHGAAPGAGRGADAERLPEAVPHGGHRPLARPGARGAHGGGARRGWRRRGHAGRAAGAWSGMSDSAATGDPGTTGDLTQPTAAGWAALGVPQEVRLVEVGLRDGLQAVPEPLRTEDKVELVRLLIDAGLTEIEAVSFAHPRVLPQLADAAEVMAAVPRPDGVRYRGLAPNLKGVQRAVECGLDEVVVVISADEEVSRRNQRRGTAELVAELPDIARIVSSAGARLVVAVACAFFAPARGPVPRTDRELV